MHLFHASNEPKEKPSVLLLTYMHSGKGDFMHLFDIAKEFNLFSETLGINLVTLTLCKSEEDKNFVANKLEKLPIKFNNFIFHLPEEEAIEIESAMQLFNNYMENNKELQHFLKNCLSIFQISTALTREHQNLLLKYVEGTNTSIVNIGEHFGMTQAFYALAKEEPSKQYPHNITDRCMGLIGKENEERYGIKLKSYTLSKEDAFLTLENKQIQNALLSGKAATPENVKIFFQEKQFFPGYFQADRDFFAFMRLCLEHKDIHHENKNIIFYLNDYEKLFSDRTTYMTTKSTFKKYGINLEPPTEDPELPNSFQVTRFESLLFMKIYDQTDFKGFDCFKMVDVIEINNDGKINKIILRESQNPKTLSIFTNFNVNDEDYDKLHVIADKVAGCSGDTSYEKDLSHGLLPIFPLSIKANFQSSIKKLGDIAIDILKDKPDLDKQSFKTFFSENLRLTKPSYFEELFKANIKQILVYWPSVIKELKERYNFYNHTKNIFCEAIMFKAAALDDKNLLNKIYQFFPEIDFKITNKQGKTVLMVATTEQCKLHLLKLIDDQQTNRMLFK